MNKFTNEIEVSGHLIDSLILTKIFDSIMDLGGKFEVIKIKVGKKKTDQSYARLLVQGKTKKNSSIKIISLSAFNLSVFVPNITIRAVTKVTNFNPIAKRSILK